MESAIPEHLRRTRTRQTRISSSHRPLGRGVVPRFDDAQTHVCTAYLGIQHRHGAWPQAADEAWRWLLDSLRADGGAFTIDSAVFVDRTGHGHRLLACYSAGEVFDRWWRRTGHRWTADAHSTPQVGRFAEIFRPTMDRLEAIAEGAVWHGLTRLAGRVSGPVQEQGYWGAMRDRLALSQTDAMAPEGEFKCWVEGSLIRVRPPSNLCLMRTGQDWSQGGAQERQSYLAHIEPTMKASMDLLDASGPNLGGLCNRYAWVLGEEGRTRSETFGMSVWRSLEHLERWAEVHYSHLASYLGAVRHAQQFGDDAAFSRYHEVIVPAADQVTLEYRNCHEETGLLPAALAGSRPPAE